ncbi:MAG: hypothetical protein INR71_06770, partial [Terriglobus roseus]|nr:hypothetical protein [Terriglobus roseus]
MLNAGHTLQQETLPVGAEGGAAPPQPRLTLLVHAEKLLRSANSKGTPFADGMLRLHVQAYLKSSNIVEYVVRGNLPKASAKLLVDSLSAVRDQNISFSKTGAFALKLSAPLGTSCVSSLVNRLLSLQRVRSVVTALKK